MVLFAGPRPGLPLVAMTSRQQELALALLDTSCGMAGARTARGVIELERVRRRLVTGVDELDGDRYWFGVFGEPGGAGPWGMASQRPPPRGARGEPWRRRSGHSGTAGTARSTSAALRM